MNVTLRQLRIFEAVARHQSFTRASEELHLRQPAVSMQIKQREPAVEAGLGLGLPSLHTLEMEPALKRVAVLEVETFPIMRHWYVVNRRGKRLCTAAQAFKHFMLKDAQNLLSPPELARPQNKDAG